MLVLDGVFVRTGRAPPVFIGAPAPTAEDLARILVEVRDGVAEAGADRARASLTRLAPGIASRGRVLCLRDTAMFILSFPEREALEPERRASRPERRLARLLGVSRAPTGRAGAGRRRP